MPHNLCINVAVVHEYTGIKNIVTRRKEPLILYGCNNSMDVSFYIWFKC